MTREECNKIYSMLQAKDQETQILACSLVQTDPEFVEVIFDRNRIPQQSPFWWSRVVRFYGKNRHVTSVEFRTVYVNYNDFPAYNIDWIQRDILYYKKIKHYE